MGDQRGNSLYPLFYSEHLGADYCGHFTYLELI